jgi:hypothetical protein
LYHLDEPVKFLRQLGRATRKLLMVQTHYSAAPNAVHEGRAGHWYEEAAGARWSSWGNQRSFWLARGELTAVMRESFDQVSEGEATGADRSMFTGIK